MIRLITCKRDEVSRPFFLPLHVKKAADKSAAFIFSDDRCLILSLDVVHANLDGLHVQRDELVGTLRQGVTQTLFDVLVVDDGTHLQEGTQDDHVEHLAVAHIGGELCAFDAVDMDVLTGGLVGDAVGVIDEVATGLHFVLKLVERLLIQNDGSVESVEDGGAHALVADDDGHVGRTASPPKPAIIISSVIALSFLGLIDFGTPGLRDFGSRSPAVS